MPLLERVRVETYIPDLRLRPYQNLLFTFEEEFTYAFGGCTIVRGIEGSYLSQYGRVILDRVNLIYTDLPLAFSVDFKFVAYYADEVRRFAFETLDEEVVMVVVTQVYHSVGPRSRNVLRQKLIKYDMAAQRTPTLPFEKSKKFKLTTRSWRPYHLSQAYSAAA